MYEEYKDRKVLLEHILKYLNVVQLLSESHVARAKTKIFLKCNSNNFKGPGTYFLYLPIATMGQ